MSESQSPLAQLLAQSNQQTSGLFSRLREEEINSKTTKREDQTNFAASIEVILETKEAGALIDGRSQARGAKNFTPGFHLLDKAIAGTVMPAYKSGCPIARKYILDVEEQLDDLKELLEHSKTEMGARTEHFFKENQHLIVTKLGSEHPLGRKFSFSSPHVRLMVKYLKEFETVVKYIRILSRVDVEKESVYRDQLSLITAPFRALTHTYSKYKNGNANALDFKENNKRAQLSLEENKRVYGGDLEAFLEWESTNDTISAFYGSYKTAEQIEQEQQETHDAAMAESESKEQAALKERSDLDSIAKASLEDSQDKEQLAQ